MDSGCRSSPGGNINTIARWGVILVVKSGAIRRVKGGEDGHEMRLVYYVGKEYLMLGICEDLSGETEHLGVGVHGDEERG